MKTLISQAAEAVIYLVDGKVVKDRIPKSYRLPLLDNKLRKQRTKKEARLLQKAAQIIPVPKVISVSATSLELEYIKGEKLATCLDTLPLAQAEKICKQLGSHLADLHDAGIIHGDLTTSNLILPPDQKLYFLDFGLGFVSHKIEDRAVDLHVIKEALEAKHVARAEAYMKCIVDGYKKSNRAKETLARLSIVESRGRYKQQY